MSTSVLHYKGDVRTSLADTGYLFGPSQDGRVHRIESAEYDPDTDTTTAHLEEVSPDAG